MDPYDKESRNERLTHTPFYVLVFTGRRRG